MGTHTATLISCKFKINTVHCKDKVERCCCRPRGPSKGQIKMATAVVMVRANFQKHFVVVVTPWCYVIRHDTVVWCFWRKIVQIFGLETASERLTSQRTTELGWLVFLADCCRLQKWSQFWLFKLNRNWIFIMKIHLLGFRDNLG